MGIPWFQKLLKVWRLKKKTNKSTNLLSMPQYESDFLLSQWRPQSLFYEYLEASQMGNFFMLNLIEN